MSETFKFYESQDPTRWPASVGTRAKRPLEMTHEELAALPVVERLIADVYEVQPDGTVTLPDGRVIVGLTYGNTLKVPREQRVMVQAFTHTDRMCWSDESGTFWRPIATSTGWAKERWL